MVAKTSSPPADHYGAYIVIAIGIAGLWLTGLTLYTYDGWNRVNRLESTRIAVSDGKTVMICKNVTQKLYYCTPIIREVSR